MSCEVGFVRGMNTWPLEQLEGTDVTSRIGFLNTSRNMFLKIWLLFMVEDLSNTQKIIEYILGI